MLVCFRIVFGDEVDCKSAALWHDWFDPSNLHQEYAPLDQLVRSSACHAEGQGFESPTVRQVYGIDGSFESHLA